MTNQVEKITKRRMKRVVKATALERALKNCVVISKQPVMQDGELYYEVEFIKYQFISYEALVNRLIKTRYTDSAEFAVINKGIADATNVEYVEYRNYVEECKNQAGEFIAERVSIFGK